MASCDQTPPAPPRVPAGSVVGAGVITGRVTFDGPLPPAVVVRNDPCCPGAPPTLLDESVVVNANGTLANVFVYLEGGPLTDGSALPSPVLDQVFCQYVPHVIGVVVGQPLTVRSSDPTLHNVAIRPAAGPAINMWMNAAGQSNQTQFAAPGFAGTKCDVHPWMNAVIGVFDNPYFGVTGRDGTFKIENVPDGAYTIVARHERYLSLRQPITISGGQPVSTDFSYHPPKS